MRRGGEVTSRGKGHDRKGGKRRVGNEREGEKDKGRRGE